ncbi:uncharacterized protein [Leptinotarsa decemlineata]|uniref:uncharacterized protein n=1 Tax=Leptinotarsa decemlineata TaxID=7539 RepID=UPI003D305EAD
MMNQLLFCLFLVIKITGIILIHPVSTGVVSSHYNVVTMVHTCDTVHNDLIKKCMRGQSLDVKVGYVGTVQSRNTVNVHLDPSRPNGCQIGPNFYEALKNVPELETLRVEFCYLKQIAKGLFQVTPKLKNLSIQYNEIDWIENQAFSNLNNLKHVNASHNNLDYFNSGWFDCSTNLETLDFQKNKIRFILRRTFAAFTKLKVINFDYNEISNIEPGAFEGLENLQYLGLRNNRLTNIQAEVFSNNLRIEYLAIGGNFLNFLSNRLMAKVSVGNILMGVNPWNCFCLMNIYRWLFKMNSTTIRDNLCELDNVPVCASAVSFSDSCSEYLDEELTQRYFGELQKIISFPLGGRCARLDYTQ